MLNQITFIIITFNSDHHSASRENAVGNKRVSVLYEHFGVLEGKRAQ